jgi:hypothetical protein
MDVANFGKDLAIDLCDSPVERHHDPLGQSVGFPQQDHAAA